MLLADYQSYLECQDRVAGVYGDQERWTRMSILERGPLRLLLVGSHDPGVLRGHLERAAAQG